jgi:hypothetical protein
MQGTELLQPAPPVRSTLDHQALALECDPDRFDERSLVFDDEDPGHQGLQRGRATRKVAPSPSAL